MLLQVTFIALFITNARHSGLSQTYFHFLGGNKLALIRVFLLWLANCLTLINTVLTAC